MRNVAAIVSPKLRCCRVSEALLLSCLLTGNMKRPQVSLALMLLGDLRSRHRLGQCPQVMLREDASPSV